MNFVYCELEIWKNNINFKFFISFMITVSQAKFVFYCVENDCDGIFDVY